MSPGVGRYVGVDGTQETEIAFDPELDREVLLERSDARDLGGIAALRRKSRALAMVVHPAIPRVHDVVVADSGVARVVVERPRGMAIEPWARSVPSLARRLAVMHAVGAGLGAAHAAAVAHGSFATAPIVVDELDAPRITGFLRTAVGGSVLDDRREFCRRSLVLLGEDLRRQRRARYRGLLAALRRGSEAGEQPTLGFILDRFVACRATPRRWEFVVVVGAVVVLTWAAVRPAGNTTNWCDEVERRLAEVWNPESRQRLRQAVLATGVDYAKQTSVAVDEGLEAFVDRWRTLQVSRCTARATDAAVSVCLYRKFDGLRTVIESLTAANADSVAQAVDVVAALGSPDECTQGGAAILAIAADAAATDEIRADLVASDLLRELGRYDDARAAAERAVAVATRTGSVAALAEAQCLLGQALLSLGDEAAAERSFHEAFTTGLSAGHDAVVARAAAELTNTLARRGMLEDAQMWRDHAVAAAARVLDPRLKARVAAIEARVWFEKSDYDSAATAYERALELAEQCEPRDVAAVLHARQALAITIGRSGNRGRALELLQRNVSETEARYGNGHPDFGRQTNSVATELSALGRTREGIEARRRAVEILTKTIGPAHTDTLAARSSLATDLVQWGDGEAAVVLQRELVADAESKLGRDDPRAIGHLGELGMTESLLGRYDDAIAHLRDAAARLVAQLGPDHGEVLAVLSNLAATCMFAERNDEAAPIYALVIERTKRTLGANHPQLVPALLGAARVERSLGEHDAAVDLLEAARAILAERAERPDRIGRVDWDLAQLLWERPGERERAMKLARAAHQQFVLAHSQGLASAAENVAEVTAWLQERSGR